MSHERIRIHSTKQSPTVESEATSETFENKEGVRDFPGHGSEESRDLFEQERLWWRKASPTNSGGVSGFPGHGSEEGKNSGGVSGFPGHGSSQ